MEADWAITIIGLTACLALCVCLGFMIGMAIFLFVEKHLQNNENDPSELTSDRE